MVQMIYIVQISAVQALQQSLFWMAYSSSEHRLPSFYTQWDIWVQKSRKLEQRINPQIYDNMNGVTSMLKQSQRVAEASLVSFSDPRYGTLGMRLKQTFC